MENSLAWLDAKGRVEQRGRSRDGVAARWEMEGQGLDRQASLPECMPMDDHGAWAMACGAVWGELCVYQGIICVSSSMHSRSSLGCRHPQAVTCYPLPPPPSPLPPPPPSPSMLHAETPLATSHGHYPSLLWHPSLPPPTTSHTRTWCEHRFTTTTPTPTPTPTTKNTHAAPTRHGSMPDDCHTCDPASASSIPAPTAASPSPCPLTCPFPCPFPCTFACPCLSPSPSFPLPLASPLASMLKFATAAPDPPPPAPPPAPVAAGAAAGASPFPPDTASLGERKNSGLGDLGTREGEMGGAVAAGGAVLLLLVIVMGKRRRERHGRDWIWGGNTRTGMCVIPGSDF
ncbi:unnamed protein product [Closterium sp. NIES-54]